MQTPICCEELYYQIKKEKEVLFQPCDIKVCDITLVRKKILQYDNVNNTLFVYNIDILSSCSSKLGRHQ